MYPGFRWHHFTEAKYMVNEFISPTEIKAWGIDEPVYCSWSLYDMEMFVKTGTWIPLAPAPYAVLKALKKHL